VLGLRCHETVSGGVAVADEAEAPGDTGNGELDADGIGRGRGELPISMPDRPVPCGPDGRPAPGARVARQGLVM
jgi:hypothetical protein